MNNDLSREYHFFYLCILFFLAAIGILFSKLVDEFRVVIVFGFVGFMFLIGGYLGYKSNSFLMSRIPIKYTDESKLGKIVNYVFIVVGVIFLCLCFKVLMTEI